MTKYKLSDICKTLEKLFKNNINTTEKIANLTWQEIDTIANFTPFEKSLIMDFKIIVENEFKSIKKKNFTYGIVEFLAGNNAGKEE